MCDLEPFSKIWSHIMIITITVPTLFLLKTDYKFVKLFSNVHEYGKFFMLSDDYHDLAPYDYC